MLSTATRGLASISTMKMNTKLSNLLEKYDFLTAVASDKEEIVAVTRNTFFKIEPHSRALGFTGDNNRAFVDWLVTKSLRFPHSIKVVHKESGKLIAVRLMSELGRGEKDGSEDVDISKMDENELMIAIILDNMQKAIWKLRPEAEKILRRELSFVHPDHQRQGIAQHMVHLGLDYDRLRMAGIAGITSEASSIANQTLLLKNGYEELMRSTPEDYIRSNGEQIVFPDATEAVKLLYLDFNRASHH